MDGEAWCPCGLKESDHLSDFTIILSFSLCYLNIFDQRYINMLLESNIINITISSC